MSYRLRLLVPLSSILALVAGPGCGSDDRASDEGATAAAGPGSGGASATGAGGSGATTSNGGASTTGGSGAGGGSGATTGTGGASGSGGAASSGTGGSSSGGLVRFVAFGDAGKGNQGQKDVAAAVEAKCMKDGCDFVQLLGDNIYDSGVDSTSDPQWQTKFEEPYAAIDLPFWVVLGNHDYGGGGTGAEFGKGQNQIDYTLVSTKWKLPSAYYQRVEQHVELFALDTNMAMYHQADQQAQDIAAFVAASQATWKIAFGHHPYLSNGDHGNAGEYEGLPFVPIVNGAGVKELLEDVVCGKVDVYISGHDHSMQWLQPTCGGTELIVSGAGASTTSLDGSNPSYFESLDLGFLYVKIDGNTFTGEFIGTNGDVLFSRTITK